METKMNETREEIFGLNIWQPAQEGDTLKGVIVAIDSDGQYGLQATIQKDSGETVLTPAHKWLQNCLRRLKIGESIEIEYKGEDQPKVKGQSPTKKYAVFKIVK